MTIHWSQLRGSIPLSKLATDPLARANHTGTQNAATISDFNSAVDARITASGLDPKTLDNKDPARLRMTMDESTFDAGGFSTSQQSLTVANNDRIFIEVTDSRDKSGLYVATVSSSTFSVARSADADVSAEVTYGMTVAILMGTYAGYRYVLTAAETITLGTTELTFTEFPPITALVGDGSTITISGLTISVPNGGIGTDQLADEAVTEGKLADDAVTADKLADDAVNSSQIVNYAVTNDKLAVLPITGETPTGTIDGSNASFTLAHTPYSGSLEVKRNGLVAQPTTEYTVSGDTITFESGFLPQSGDWLSVNYRYTQNQ